LQALKNGDPKSAKRTGNFDLVDFSGKEVDLDKLTQAAQQLENKVKRDVGYDNYYSDPPPLYKPKKDYSKPPKVPKWLKELLPERFKKLIEEWLEDDGQKNQATKVFTA
jgi:hypothetical protein